MKAVFRVDSSSFIGFGHLMRCLTLAKELRERGVECSFVCRDHPGNIAAKVIDSGFSVFLLERANELAALKGSELECDKWLGSSWKVDADETNEIIKAIQPEWLIVDHYSIDGKWEEALAKNYKNLMVIDDIANRDHSCDILLDQNLFINMKRRYERRVSSQCLQLLGPKYALLQTEYSQLREVAKSRNSSTKKNLLIFFGGSDQSNLTELAFLAAHSFGSEFSSINVVMPSASPFYNQMEKLIKPIKNSKLHCDLPSLAPLMLEANIGIGAGGATNWERFCLGLPSLVITLAKNQKLVNDDLSKLRLIELIGDAEVIKIEQVRTAIRSVLSRRDLADWSNRCMRECSGDGVILVADVIFVLEKSKIKLL
jgi:UDP-2,4-diacetamido-2,4,6-trideoxy-beta-L-altropyranose hydrolase